MSLFLMGRGGASRQANGGATITAVSREVESVGFHATVFSPSRRRRLRCSSAALACGWAAFRARAALRLRDARPAANPAALFAARVLNHDQAPSARPAGAERTMRCRALCARRPSLPFPDSLPCPATQQDQDGRRHSGGSIVFRRQPEDAPSLSSSAFRA